MPLSLPKVARSRAHLRRIEVEGFLREDGLLELDARLTDHPNGTYLQPISLRAAPGAAARKRLYIAASAPAMPVFDAHKARLRNDPAWTFVEVQGGHDAMVDHADTIARLLDAHA